MGKIFIGAAAITFITSDTYMKVMEGLVQIDDQNL